MARHIAPYLPRLSLCANLAHIEADEGANDGWGMDYVLALDVGSGRVRGVTPHGDTTRAKPRVTACVTQTLSGAVLIEDGAIPSSITLSFTNRYVRPR